MSECTERAAANDLSPSGSRAWGVRGAVAKNSHVPAGVLLNVALLLARVNPVAAALPQDEAGPDASAAARCQALAGTDFSGIPEAPAQVTTSVLVDDVHELLGDLGVPTQPELVPLAVKHLGTIRPYCRVRGYVAPSVGFELLLPVKDWNGKFLHVGCFGWCGTTATVGLFCAKNPHYACVGSNMGHSGGGGLWFRNNPEGQIDFSYRATHVATLAGKAITQYYYRSAPKKSYFIGCSTGGYQGMVEAQRFPWDFDGIVAGAPDMDEADLAVRLVWIKQNFMGSDGKPVLRSEEIGLIHQAALGKCDMDDGVKDGIISDPMHCPFDPTELLCKGDMKRACLSGAQVRAVQNIYGVPVNSKGTRLSTRGVLPGSELNWTEAFAQTWGDSFFRDTATLGPAGEDWRFTDFNFDRDYPRSGVGVLFVDTNPDLRRFKAAGGKLISYQGTNDATQIPGAIFDYYETVERTMGGRVATQDFFRLFALPGVNHCIDGDGVFVVDYLGYLEAWVEQGTAPAFMVGAHPDQLQKDESWFLKTPLSPDTHVAFTRPLYPYPQYAKYKGHGDPNKPENFRPAVPERSQ